MSGALIVKGGYYSSGPTLVDMGLIADGGGHSWTTGVTALPGGRDRALPLRACLNFIDGVAGPGSGVALPRIVGGQMLYVSNRSSSDITVWTAANTTDTIVSIGAGDTLPAGASRTFVSVADGWIEWTGAGGGGGGAFLPLTGGTVTGPTTFSATGLKTLVAGSGGGAGGKVYLEFNPTNPRNGSGSLFINKVGGTAAGDDPQITSYLRQDHDGSANPFHVKIVSSATSNSGMWSLMNQSYFSANDTGTTNGHVGFYSQQIRTGVNAGGTRGIAGWCSVMELRSQTGLPSSQDGILQTLELDLLANGADDLSHSVGFGRTVLSIVIGQNDPAGAAVEVSNGISFFMFSGGSNGHYINMLTAAAPFSASVLNTTTATQLTNANAIWLRDGHNIAFNTAGTAQARWTGTTVEFTQGVQVDGTIYTPSTLTVGGVSTLAGGLTVGAAGPNIRSGTGAATGTQPKGSIWMRTDGAVGSTMYVSQGGGTWNAVAGV